MVRVYAKSLSAISTEKENNDERIKTLTSMLEQQL